MKLPIYKAVFNEEDETTGVSKVALVDEPAIERIWQTFNETKSQFFFNDEKKVVSGALMVANLPIYRRDENMGEYYIVFDAPTIEKIVKRFHKHNNGKNVNLMHDNANTKEGVYMYESFIINSKRGINTPTGNEPLPDGSWFGSFQVEDEALWNEIKQGKFMGFSVEGLFGMTYSGDAEKSLMETIKNTINQKFEQMKFDIKKMFTKEEVELKFMDVKAIDGTIVRIMGEAPSIGVPVMVVTESGELPAPDGDLKLEDGTILKVAGGIINEIVPADKPEEAPEVEEPMADNKEVMSNDGKPVPTRIIKTEEKIFSQEEVDAKINEAIEKFKAEFEASKVTEIETIKSEFSKEKEELNKKIVELSNAPAAEPIEAPKDGFAKFKAIKAEILEARRNLNK